MYQRWFFSHGQSTTATEDTRAQGDFRPDFPNLPKLPLLVPDPVPPIVAVLLDPFDVKD